MILESDLIVGDNFFKELNGFGDFSDISNPLHYKAVPDDWVVVLADVRSSTKAIEAGRYKEVNMVGAACIAAVVNTCKDINVPYVFGGDGATFLIPPAYLDIVRKNLLAVKRFAFAMHNLILRVGAIPVSEIKALGKGIDIAKYSFKTGQDLAMFKGGGLALADELVKKNARYLFADDTDKEFEPNLDGLSCRWHPIPAKRGTVMSLLVMANGDTQEHAQIYTQINKFLYEVLEEDQNPAANGNLTYKWPSRETLRQSQMVWKRGSRFKNYLQHIAEILLFNIMNRFNLAIKGLNVPEYKDDMITNSDYRKFDDMLRMVIDCHPDQAQKIEEFLLKLHEEGKLAFGTHYSDKALMTCFVQTLKSDGHTHFIDGNDGGYAMAALALKERLKVIKDFSSAAIG